ncbi:hypothetical protein L6452_20535 [Arctium lappa]|uniref:Uncharacterized protein n=1 Tax=Arctium lappa TaxID=4217 RepID=A0ACB9BCG7_ARCLA|nr:hypothetical protein L6452_20535 [Arctium lappa]
MPEQVVEETRLLQVGYALPTRKIESFMIPQFINYAKQQNVHFIPIDISQPLTNQGHFDIIIHKLYTHQWNQNLHHFTTTTTNHHPNTTTVIIDPPSAIHRLHNRITMLQPISQLAIPQLTTPTQQLVHHPISSLKLDFSFPVIVKPLLVDGSSNSHDMSLVFNDEGLTKALTKGLELEPPPMVVQQFVNHGGVMFKVYVAGEYVKCVKRSSLPDVLEEMVEKMGLECGGVMKFSQISSGVTTLMAAAAGDEVVEMPAPEFVVAVAEGLRVELGLRLFNFDMIRDEKGDGYLVIDINYFPGYEKLEGFEMVMTEFFLNVKESENQKKMMTTMVDDESQVLKE